MGERPSRTAPARGDADRRALGNDTQPERRPELAHWHPVLPARALGDRPRSVTLLGVEIALFRTRAGRVGALVDVCPHRRMRLSCGWVEGDRLVCPYHGYTFDADGRGESAATPRLRAPAVAFEAVERHGAIWLRARGAATRFPRVDRAGFHPLGVLSDRVRAPLELVVDNFCEVEHTPTTHALFGYERAALPRVEVRVETGPEHIRVENRGPQKAIPKLVERMFGVRAGDTFVDDWTVYFSPVHIVYWQYWIDRVSGEMKPEQIHVSAFFNPIDAGTTQLMTFAAVNRSPWGRAGLNALLMPVMRQIVAREVRLDRRMIERIADKDPDLRGTRLGRFDQPLREHRRRIDRIYRAR